eukprot:3159267-Alexandrium_andersonii.AAC.1
MAMQGSRPRRSSRTRSSWLSRSCSPCSVRPRRLQRRRPQGPERETRRPAQGATGQGRRPEGKMTSAA